MTINSHATHHIVRGWTNFHRFGGDVHTGKLLELVVHTGQLALNVRRCIRQLLFDPADVQIHAAVRRSAAGLNFSVDAARNVVAGQKFRWTVGVLVAAHVAPALFLILGNLIAVRIRHVIKHEALAFAVAQHAAFAANAFGDKNAAHAGWPDHAGWVELHKLHIHEFGACFIGKRVAVASSFPAVTGDSE